MRARRSDRVLVIDLGTVKTTDLQTARREAPFNRVGHRPIPAAKADGSSGGHGPRSERQREPPLCAGIRPVVLIGPAEQIGSFCAACGYQPGRSLMRAGRVRSTVITAAFSSTTAIQPAVAVLVKAFRFASRLPGVPSVE
jgi:hypothetical protein